MVQVEYTFFRAAAALCAAALSIAVPSAAYGHQMDHARHHVPLKSETEAACAAHAIWGEARGLTVREDAVLLKEILNNVKLMDKSICAVARDKFIRFEHGKNHNSSSPQINAAINDVFKHGASLVNRKFRNVIQNRAPSLPRLHDKCLVYLGQVDPPRGNVYYGHINNCKSTSNNR